MFNKKKGDKMSNNVKELRTRVLSSMKKCQVKPPKFMFPNITVEEYNKVPSTNGYHVIWTKNKMSYNFASITINGVINQVLKLEGLLDLNEVKI
tara:strand:- start:746 stop:1027 length:282 start_codon:yes stop_codon:yes gene_type:complete